MSESPSTQETAAPTASNAGCLAGERVAFTGTLASMTHRQAHELVEKHGGVATDRVSRQTTILVVGEEGWPLDDEGHPSQDFRNATTWQAEGGPLRLLNESEWLSVLGDAADPQTSSQLYTPAMLSQLLDLSVGVIRRWERLGLIKPVRKVFRLPYFDFREVSGVRKLADLLAGGVPRDRIEVGLQALAGIVGDADRASLQMDLLARGSHVLVRDTRGLLEPATSQRFLDFEGPPDDTNDDAESRLESIPLPDRTADRDLSAAEWLEEGCRLLDSEEPQAAVEAFRMSLMENPGEPAANFHLAEALYRLDNPRGAIERYYSVVEADHDYVEAWTQMACLHAELEETESAIDALRIALDVHPDFPDAHLHLAELLHKQGLTDDAVEHWQRYLEFDSRGPWAEQARQRLEDVTSVTPADRTE